MTSVKRRERRGGGDNEKRMKRRKSLQLYIHENVYFAPREITERENKHTLLVKSITASMEEKNG